MHYLWLGLIVLVIIIDIETSNILLSWISIAFIGAFFIGSAGNGLGVQVAFSALASIPLLLLGNQVSRKYIHTKIKPVKMGPENLVGMKIHAEEDFTEELLQNINGVFWKIVSDEPVSKGESLRITGLTGNKLHVEKIRKEKETN